MKAISKYTCDLCHREYNDEASAEQCEQLGVPLETKHIKVEDEIKFFRKVVDSDMTVMQLKEFTGVVKAIQLNFNRFSNKHQHVFMVSMEDEGVKLGAIVSLVDEDGNGAPMWLASSTMGWEMAADVIKHSK